MDGLTPRQEKILNIIIRNYVTTALPVSSERVLQDLGIAISSATVRNDMAVLEEQGYIAHPHTSAGRVPTAKGYRYFVDSLMVVQPLEDVEIHRLEGELSADRPQQLVSNAASLLSHL